jgi:predicted glycosyltransferase involved in capsule biosynthesis
LREIRGYDEIFTKYAPEDRDCWERLIKVCDEVADSEFLVEHFWHPVSPQVPEWGFEGNQKYHNKIMNNLPTNPGEWGGG